MKSKNIVTLGYVLTNRGKLFSFHRHDYNIQDGIYIDGGFDYIRTNGKVQFDTIQNLIGDIREQFKWGKNYNKDGTRLEHTEYHLLKDLSTDHIIAILIYFTEKVADDTSVSKTWKMYHLIFLNELKYRHENNIH